MTYQNPFCPPLRGNDSYLATEVCIISEDDGHVVIAVRVPKAAIGRNLAFLAALADVSPPSETLDAPQARSFGLRARP